MKKEEEEEGRRRRFNLQDDKEDFTERVVIPVSSLHVSPCLSGVS